MVLGLAAFWTAGTSLRLRGLAEREEARVGDTGRAVHALVDDARQRVMREATLLAREPGVVEGVRRADWATLARGLSPRLLSLTVEGVADLLLVVGADGRPLVQMPATPPIAVTAVPIASGRSAAVRLVGEHVYLLGVSPVGQGAPAGAGGRVVVGRRLERLELGAVAGGAAVVAVTGDALRGATLDGLPQAGWARAVAAGAVEASGRRWHVLPLGTADDVGLWALVAESGVRAERRAVQASALTSLGAALAAVAAAWLLGWAWAARRRERAAAAAPRTPARPAGGEHGRADLEALYRAAAAVAGGADLVANLEETLDIVRGFARTDVGLVYSLDTSRRSLVLVAARGLSPGDIEGVRVWPVDGSRAGEAVRTGALTVVELSAAGVAPELRRLVEDGGHRALLALPIPVHGETWGVLALLSREARPVDAAERLLLQAVAHQLGLGVGRAGLLAETQAKTHRLETLTRLAQALSATLSVDEVLRRVVDAAVELLESSVARLWLLEEDGAQLTLRAESSMPTSPPTLRGMPVGDGLVGWIAAHREPLRLPDLLADPRVRNAARLREEGVVSFAGVPLLAGDRVLGVLAIATRRRHEYSAEEMAVFQSLANHAAVAIENARLFAEERTRRAYLAAVLDINTKIGALASTETLLVSIAEEAARLLDVDNAGFRLLEGEELVLAGLAGTARETMLAPRLRVGESLSGRVVQEGRTLTASLEAVAGDVVPEHLAADRRLGYTTFLGVPLRFGERTIGVFTFRARRAFAPRDIELAEAFAGQAAVALEHARLYREATGSADRMRALADVGRLLSETLDSAAVGQRVVDAICGLLGARSAALYRQGEGDELTLVTESRPGGVFDWTRVLPAGVGIAGLAVRARAPVAAPDVLDDPRIDYPPDARARVGENAHRALIGVPIRVRDRLFGALAVADRTGRRFDAEEVGLAQVFADAAGLALVNAQLYAEATRRQRAAEELARLAGTLTESLDVSAVVERTVERVLRLFDAQSSVLRLLQPDGSLVAVALGGRSREYFEPGHVLPPGAGVLGRAVTEGRAVASSDALNDPALRLTDELRHGLATSADGAILAVPLRAKGTVMGALGVTDRPGRVFSDEEIGLLQTFADQATLALENARLFSAERVRSRQIATLAEIERELAAELDSGRLLELIVERATRLFRANGAIFLLDDGDVLVPKAWTEGGTFADIRLRPGEGLVGACAAARRGEIANDYARSPHALLRAVAADVRHAMAQPLVVRERLVGVITMNRTGDGAAAFLPEELGLLESFAAQAAIAIENAGLYRAAADRASRLRTLARLNHLVTSSLDPDDVLATIARAAGQIMRVPFVAVWVVDDTGEQLQMRGFWGMAADAPFQVTSLRIGEGVVGAAAAERRTIEVPDLFEDGRFLGREWARVQGLRSVRATPILHRDALLGVLVLAAPVPIRVAADEEEDLLQSFTAQAAAAIHNARLYQEARANADRLRALEEVNRLVSSSLNVEEVLRNLARAVAQFFDAPFVSVWSYDLARRRLHRAVTHGDPQLMTQLNDELAEGEGAVGWVVEHRQPILGIEIATDPRVINADELLGAGLRWLTCYPIAIGDRVLGAFTVHRPTAWAATPEAESLMGSLAAQAAIALENARLYAETSRRLTETRSLLEVAEVLNSTLDVQPLLKRVAVTVAQVCRVDRCSVELFDGDRVIPLMSQFADGRRDPAMWAAFTSMRPWAPGVVPVHARAIETRAPVAIDDVTGSDAIPADWQRLYGIRSYMAVPLVRQDRVIGVMNLDYCDRAHPFADWQRDLALAIGGQLALALENGRLYTEVQERLHETTTLLTVGQVLSQPGVGEDMMRQLAAGVARSFGADMVGAYQLSPARDVLVPVGGYHVPKHLLDFFRRQPLSLSRSPRLAEACRSGRAVAVSDVHADPEFDPDWTRTLPPYATVFVPTMAHGAAVGGLFLVWWKPGRTFTPAELRLAEGVAAQVGLAMENAELARQTRARLQETETLLSVSRALSSTLDFDALVRHFLRAVATTLDADCVGSWLLAEDGEWFEPLAGYRIPPGRLEAFRGLRVSLRHHAFYAEAAAARRPVFTSDAMADPRLPRHVLEAGPHRSQLFVPVVARDRMIAGFAAVWWERSRQFTPEELALMEAISSQAGVALENARLFADNRRRVDELSVLHELSRTVTGQLDRAALLEAIRSQVARVLDISNLVILLRDADRGLLEVVLRTVDGVADTDAPREFPLRGVGLMSVVLEHGVPLRSTDYAADCVRYGVTPIANSAARRHWLGVPMRAGDAVLGVLVLRSRERAFTEADERLLVNIGQLAALALRSARLFEERTGALAELQAAQDQLVRTEKLRALGEMASGVAHDFNNLLASVLGRAQLLLRRIQEPQQRQWLQVIERAALDGAQTVRRLQEFTRIRRDEPLVPLDLAGVVRDALEITQSRWADEPHRRGVTIEVRTAVAPVAPVAGDAVELREVMTNLILNALDAMPEGGVLALATTMVDDDHVRVTVADTGVGMPPGVRERIFDPFFTTKGPQGTGLGLSMTYGIISRHHASIEVDSEPGKGTTFRLTFERARQAALPAPVAVERAPPVHALTCLVVDDEEAVGSVLGDILEATGHTAVVLVDGGEAIARFRAEPFDLVFTDLAMPRVSGWQVARAVKQVAPCVPVVLVTGFGVELTSDERRAHGVDAVLVKPLQIQEVLDAVAEMARIRA